MKFENIAYLLGAYFHQDWFFDAPNSDDIVKSFIERESSARVLALKQEITLLLLDDIELSSDFIANNNGYYDPTPDGLTVREWFQNILKVLP
ncbi:contact-dependent growth inhibition system immunity protein [Entomohabitans teleogrylli]|uniref:contact-dependent growth inhibition system immunity protein n=1 Tax=Entomohabitans teleogrylli TaxID=1384589 RepID=UPI00073D2904|nr:contact-dependent growth inhibition system immunity protein [Entomohabitans teleogrylli]